jgi:hypothetical protein
MSFFGTCSENNVKTITGDDGGEINKTYEYTYNDNGFPLTKKQVGGEDKETYTYKEK